MLFCENLLNKLVFKESLSLIKFVSNFKFKLDSSLENCIKFKLHHLSISLITSTHIISFNLFKLSDDITSSVQKVKNKLVEIKNDKDGNLAVSIGRKTFPGNKLIENLKSVIEFLKKEKPNVFNSENIKRIYVSSTMGPSYKLNFKEI